MSEYDPLKGIKKTQATLMTEAIGYGVAGNIAASITGPGATVASGVFSTGASLAGMPSLMSGASNVMGSLDMLYPKKKK